MFNVTSHDEKDSDAQTNEIKVIEPQNAPQTPPVAKTLTVEQFTLAMNSDAKGIKATLDAIDAKKISANSNQYNKLKIQLEKLNKAIIYFHYVTTFFAGTQFF